MFGYVSMMALMVAYLVAIVLHALFVRRIVALRNGAAAARREYDQLQSLVTALAEEVGAFRGGIDTNSVAVRRLESEIEELHQQIKNYVPEEEEQTKRKNRTSERRF